MSDGRPVRLSWRVAPALVCEPLIRMPPGACAERRNKPSQLGTADSNSLNTPEISTAEIGSEKDTKRIFYFDLPRMAK